MKGSTKLRVPDLPTAASNSLFATRLLQRSGIVEGWRDVGERRNRRRLKRCWGVAESLKVGCMLGRSGIVTGCRHVGEKLNRRGLEGCQAKRGGSKGESF